MSINPFDPILDQPQSIDSDSIDAHATYLLANHDLHFYADAETDLHDLVWPWADKCYARYIRMRVSDAHGDAHGEGLMPMVIRYFNGYQEVILGSEGVIISKRLTVPLGSNYDRAVLWMLECQAEGDRLLRLEIEIDWGEPLTQRMVDGLLVAQQNPGRAQGIYAQQNADSTRVFGNPQGRPSSLELDDENGRATLVYYVLVNGIVEVPLILTISDVGEQVAWNGFLSLRDTERAFELSVEAWNKLVRTGRLWTSDPQLNRAVQAGRLATARHMQRLRTGIVPKGGQLAHVPSLLKSIDTYDVIQSRNILAMVRRVAERSQGKLPPVLPVHPKEDLVDPGHDVAQTNRIYLAALWQHLQRHPDASLLGQHADAIRLCAEQLVQLRMQNAEAENTGAKNTKAESMEAEAKPDGEALAYAGAGLRQAVNLATLLRDSANAVRWESEACEYERLAEEAGGSRLPAPDVDWLADWLHVTGWQLHGLSPWQFASPEKGIALAGDAVWRGCGLQWRQGKLGVYPKRGNPWRWWALLDLPTPDGAISLVWDGTTLHSTQPVRSDQPVAVYTQIRARNTDELDFDLQFEMIGPQDLSTESVPDRTTSSTTGNTAVQDRVYFRPVFDTDG